MKEQERAMKLQMRHRQLTGEPADPADEFDVQALKAALQILAAVIFGVLAGIATDKVEASILAPGDETQNHAPVRALAPPPAGSRAEV
jgi:hypothetical protein